MYVFRRVSSVSKVLKMTRENERRRVKEVKEVHRDERINNTEIEYYVRAVSVC